MKDLINRWKRRKEWWVCIYEIDNLSKSKETGRFAEFGETKKDAEENARKYIEETSLINGTAHFYVRRPSIIEVIFY